MYSTRIQPSEQKRKQDKMNMVLNNLEQKLGADQELCQGIANIIDMTIEVNELIQRLERVKTNIPVIEQKIIELMNRCALSCSEARKDVCSSVYGRLSETNQENAPAKMIKVQRTIDYCIANYLTYTKSQYYAKYSVGIDSTRTTSSMSIKDLLMLV